MARDLYRWMVTCRLPVRGVGHAHRIMGLLYVLCCTLPLHSTLHLPEDGHQHRALACRLPNRRRVFVTEMKSEKAQRRLLWSGNKNSDENLEKEIPRHKSIKTPMCRLVWWLLANKIHTVSGCLPMNTCPLLYPSHCLSLHPSLSSLLLSLSLFNYHFSFAPSY